MPSNMSEISLKRPRHKTIFERNKFFATTTMAGFGFIHRSNNRLEVIVWYLIIICFSYVTVKNVVALTTQFIYQSTVTRVTIGRMNESYDLNVFKLRVRVGLPEFNHEFHTQDEYLYNGLNYSLVQYNKSLSFEVDQALARLNTYEKFFRTRWRYVLLPLMSRFAFYISSCEFFNEYCNSFSHGNLEFRTFTNPGFRSVRREIEKVRQHARKLGITDGELLEELGRQALRWVRFDRSPDIFTPWRGRSLGVLPSYEMEGSVLFLFELRPSKNVNVGLNSESGICIRCSIYPFVREVHRSGILGPEATIHDAYHWYSNYKPEMDVQFGLDNRRHLNSFVSEISYWSIDVTASFHSIKNCYADNSKYRCTHACTAAAIERYCDCQTVLISSNTSESKPFCTIERYKSCLSETHENIFSKCNQKCMSNCDMDFLEVRIADRGPHAETHMEICLNVLHREVPIFEEHYPQTWQNFLAELGGAVDFWLGASVVGIIHLLVHIVKQIVYAFYGRTKAGKHVRSWKRHLQSMSEHHRGLEDISRKARRRLPPRPKPVVPPIVVPLGLPQSDERMDRMCHKVEGLIERINEVGDVLKEVKVEMEQVKSCQNRFSSEHVVIVGRRCACTGVVFSDHIGVQVHTI